MKKGKYECNGKPYARVSSRTSVGLRVVGYLNLENGNYEDNDGENKQRTYGYEPNELDKMDKLERLYLRVEGKYFRTAGWRLNATEHQIVWEKDRGPREELGIINFKFL